MTDGWVTFRRVFVFGLILVSHVKTYPSVFASELQPFVSCRDRHPWERSVRTTVVRNVQLRVASGFVSYVLPIHYQEGHL